MKRVLVAVVAVALVAVVPVAPVRAQGTPVFTGSSGALAKPGDPIKLREMIAAFQGKADSSRLDAVAAALTSLAAAYQSFVSNVAASYAPTSYVDKVTAAAAAAAQTYANNRLAAISPTVSWTVCATGCTFTSPLDAWEGARRQTFYGPDTSIVIHVADGTYTITGQFLTDQPGTGYIQMVGNAASPGNVVFSFTNITGNNGSGFLVRDGGRLGRQGFPGIDGVTLRGVGALSGRSTWADQSYGAGILATGSGANAYIGAHVVIDGFYYSLLADQTGHIVADGATLRNAGDVNALARFGGMIECQSCSFVTASHVFINSYGQAQTLGYSAMAEAGGAFYGDNSTATDAELACYVARSNGAMWAHAVTATACKGFGAAAEEGGMLELNHARLLNNQTGLHAISGGVVGIDAIEVSGSTYDGLFVDGGRVQGTTVSSHNNGGYGVRVQKQGRAELYDALARLTGNAAGAYFVEQEYGCGTDYEPCSPGSTMIIDGTPEPGWRIFAPAVSSSTAGLVATASMHARAAHGNTFSFTLTINVSTVGGSGAVVVAMPLNTVFPCAVVGQEHGATGRALIGQWSGTNMFINFFDNSYPVVSGTTSLTVSGPACEVVAF